MSILRDPYFKFISGFDYFHHIEVFQVGLNKFFEKPNEYYNEISNTVDKLLKTGFSKTRPQNDFSIFFSQNVLLTFTWKKCLICMKKVNHWPLSGTENRST